MNPETTSSYSAGSDMPCVPVATESQKSADSSRHEHLNAEDRLDWDAGIAVAPKRPSGWIEVTLEYGGRGTPSPVDDPWA